MWSVVTPLGSWFLVSGYRSGWSKRFAASSAAQWSDSLARSRGMIKARHGSTHADLDRPASRPARAMHRLPPELARLPDCVFNSTTNDLSSIRLTDSEMPPYWYTALAK
ncbi:unnamed protein product [Arctia plantaginis]|uniref:Uncharacterized protein n=1 Tax=Arctia plantaginis TaxID=874455 RepID=A0A8S1A450_ARCPL|nr:unnamed protein product [Arctia plantaginis]